MVYPTLLPLMRTPRLPVVDWTDATCRFKWTRPFRRRTKSGFCTCAITFQTQFYSNRLNTIQYGWFWCLLYNNTQCTCNLTMRCIRVTIVAVSSVTACSVRIVVNLLASVRQYKKFHCVHGNTTIHSLCIVDGLRNISYWLCNNMNVLKYSRKVTPAFLSIDFRVTIRFPRKSFHRFSRNHPLSTKILPAEVASMHAGRRTGMTLTGAFRVLWERA
jgi:hypothetical protein